MRIAINKPIAKANGPARLGEIAAPIKFAPTKSAIRHRHLSINNFCIRVCYFIPNNLPSFDCRPVRDIGMPVFRDTRRFAFVTPNARFHENEIPGPSFITPPQVITNLADPCSRLTARKNLRAMSRATTAQITENCLRLRCRGLRCLGCCGLRRLGCCGLRRVGCRSHLRRFGCRSRRCLGSGQFIVDSHFLRV